MSFAKRKKPTILQQVFKQDYSKIPRWLCLPHLRGSKKSGRKKSKSMPKPRTAITSKSK